MKPAVAGSHAALVLDTRRLVPFHVRHRAAQRRLAGAFGSILGPGAIALHFERAVADLRGLGLFGPGLIVAAEHMTATRLRELVDRLDTRPKLAATARGLQPSPAPG